MKKFFRFLNLRDESGAALVIVAISMVVLLGFTALVIDVGRLYSEKSNLQNALDAAALAGAQGLKVSEAQAITNAKEVAQSNGFPITETNLTVTSDSIRVTRNVMVPLTFARVIGHNESEVGATAKAMAGHLRKANGITPIAVEESQIPNGTALTCFNPGGQQGNCGFVSIAGTGAKDLSEAIKNGSTYTVGNQIETEPGEMWGPVNTAIDSLIKSDKDKPQCQAANTADKTCKRVINVVITDTWVGADGRSVVNVVGFAAYWIEGFDKDKVLIGKFLERYKPGEIGDTDVGTLYGAKLVE
ncbi:pilus assembly protein TadG-related protein [Neobacillus drentensis]|uniref:pilus assembly protein TadG-related protein n=1 Tax=Neobacillus drentensis TaxID=220684 RepID=UPI002FFED1E3